MPRDSHCLGHHPNHCLGHRLVILSSSSSVALSLTSCHLGHCHSRHRSHRRSYCHSRRLAIALASSLWPLPRASSQLSSAVAPIAATFPPLDIVSVITPGIFSGVVRHRHSLRLGAASAAIASTSSAAARRAQQLSLRRARQLSSYRFDGLSSSAAIASTGSAAQQLSPRRAQQLSSYRLDVSTAIASTGSAAQQLSPRRAQQLSSYRLDRLSS